MTGESIAKKWFPYSVYLFYLTVLLNTIPLAVIYLSKCELMICHDYPNPQIAFGLFLIFLSGFLVRPFYIMAKKNYRETARRASGTKDMPEAFYVRVIIVFSIATIISPLLSIILVIVPTIMPLYKCL